MSRIAIMVHLAGGGTDNCGIGNDGEPTLYPLLSEARAELQEHLKDVAEAAAQDHLEDDHSVADYYLHDTKTGTTYDLAWGPGKVDLLVRVSHAEVLSALAAAATAGAADGQLAFRLDVAKTAAEFGCTDHRNTQVVLMPSQDGPNWDKHAIAPSSMTSPEAIKFVNDACARANDLQEAIDTGGWDDDGVSVRDRIDLYLEEAGFTILSSDEGNLRMAQAWDQEPAPRAAEDIAPAP